MATKEKYLRQTMTNIRSTSKAHLVMKTLYDALLKKGKKEIYYSTKNKEWFKTRFKDVNNCEVVLEETDGCDLFKLSLKQ